MTIPTKQLSLTINAKAVGPIDVPETMMMQDFLYEYLNLTGSRMGCGQGICHACKTSQADLATLKNHQDDRSQERAVVQEDRGSIAILRAVARP